MPGANASQCEATVDEPFAYGHFDWTLLTLIPEADDSGECIVH